MALKRLGRTNREFPDVWLSLSTPLPSADRCDLSALVGAARATELPIDVSSAPALWGGHMRGADESFLTQLSSAGYENATDDRHAGDLIQAHLIETLSSIGREWIDIYFLRVRRAVEEFQIAGVLEALELARQEGHIRFLGICCDGPSMATLGTWQFHDAFDVLLVPRNHRDPEAYQTLNPLARERNVGVVTSRPFNWGYGIPFFDLPIPGPDRAATASAVVADLARENPVMVGVRSEAEIAAAISPRGDASNLQEIIQPYRDSFEAESTWKSLAESGQPHERAAADRRLRDMAGLR